MSQLPNLLPIGGCPVPDGPILTRRKEDLLIFTTHHQAMDRATVAGQFA